VGGLGLLVAAAAWAGPVESARADDGFGGSVSSALASAGDSGYQLVPADSTGSDGHAGRLAFLSSATGAWAFFQTDGLSTVTAESVQSVLGTAQLSAPSSALAEGVSDSASAVEAAEAAGGESVALAGGDGLTLGAAGAAVAGTAGVVVGGLTLGLGIGYALDQAGCDAGLAAVCTSGQPAPGFVPNADQTAAGGWVGGLSTITASNGCTATIDESEDGNQNTSFSVASNSCDSQDADVDYIATDSSGRVVQAGGMPPVGQPNGDRLNRGTGGDVQFWYLIEGDCTSIPQYGSSPGNPGGCGSETVPIFGGAGSTYSTTPDPDRYWLVKNFCADGSEIDATSDDFTETESFQPIPKPGGCIGSELSRYELHLVTVGGSDSLIGSYTVPASILSTVDASPTCAAGGCVLGLESDRTGSWVSCYAGGDCSGWFTDQSDFRCTYGPPGTEYVVATSECNALAHTWDPSPAYRPISDPRTGDPGPDPDPGTGPNMPVPSPSPTTGTGTDPTPTATSTTGVGTEPTTRPTVTATTLPTTRPSSTPTATSTAVVGPDPTSSATSSPGTPIGGPGTTTDTAGAACWPSGWGAFNPFEWVLKPSECALAWAFEPSPDLVSDEIDSLNSNLAGSGVVAWGTSLHGLADSMGGLTDSAADCQGPHFVFTLPFAGTQDFYPFNSCTDPQATFAHWVKLALTILCGFGAVLAVTRNLTNSIGVSVTPGAGSEDGA
jgi:hypothetical protein